MSSFDPAVQRLLVVHGGVISRRELLELKVSPSAIARRVTAGEFVPVLPGVDRPATTPLTPELRLRAVVTRQDRRSSGGSSCRRGEDMSGSATSR